MKLFSFWQSSLHWDDIGAVKQAEALGRTVTHATASVAVGALDLIDVSCNISIFCHCYSNSGQQLSAERGTSCGQQANSFCCAVLPSVRWCSAEQCTSATDISTNSEVCLCACVCLSLQTHSLQLALHPLSLFSSPTHSLTDSHTVHCSSW